MAATAEEDDEADDEEDGQNTGVAAEVRVL